MTRHSCLPPAICHGSTTLPESAKVQALSLRTATDNFNATLPLWGYDLDINGIRHHGATRAITARDAADRVMVELEELENADDADRVESVVITLHRHKGE